MSHVAGVDLGATNLRAAVASDEGSIIARSQRDTPSEAGRAVADAVKETLSETIADAGLDSADIDRAGVASLGPLDHTAGAVVAPPNHQAARIPVVDGVTAAVDAPVVLRNDATAGAIGVRFYGESPSSNLVYVTISSGLGAGAIVDGRPLVGSTSNAAEAGHFTLKPNSDVRCGCGGTGHWEAFCSGENLPQYARHMHRREELSTDLTLSAVDARDLFEAARDDRLAGAVLDRFGWWNALGVATLVHAYDPSEVVFGGAVSLNHPEAVLGPIREELPALVVREPPTVELTPLGRETVLRGAVATAVNDRRRTSD